MTMEFNYASGNDYLLFLVTAAERRKIRHMERYGQAFFNVLHLEYPAIANAIRSTPYDPFFKEDVSPETMQRVLALYEEMARDASCKS
ncbi:MAG: hypothetical protein EBV64_11400 [Oxalobacteraceae bacterium]|nr:hypothetical protein [Oxalobacteraceae bacterium]